MLPEPIVNNLFNLATGLIGALIGGAFTLYATVKTLREEERKEDRQEQKEVQNLLYALGVELNALWGFHMQRVGHLVESLTDGQALEFYYPLTQNYFTVYDANATMLGKIADASLRSAIVITYNKCKKVVDGFKYNNQLYRDWRELCLKDDAAPASRKFQEMAAYAKLIREDHFFLKSCVEDVLARLGP